MTKNKYNLGDIVYLITDVEQIERMVTEVKFIIGGSIIYTLAQGTVETTHYEQEMCSTKNIFKALNIQLND